MSEVSAYNKEFDRIYEISGLPTIYEEPRIPYNICRDCKIYNILEELKGYYVCPRCGLVSNNYQVYKLDYKDEKNMVYTVPYRRINYFRKYITKSKILDYKLENKLCEMFEDINIYFKNNVKGRRNFIKYDFLVRQLLFYLGYPTLAVKFKKPKRKKTLKAYTKIWKDICIHLNYEMN